MTDQERKLIEMAYDGILRIDRDGLIWKCKKKHKEWDGYQKCRPYLLGHECHGYIRIALRDADGNNLKAFAHRLVFMYFYGDIPEGLQINHRDGNGHDNRLRNLELMTQSQNMIHAITILGKRVGNRTKGKNRRGVHWKIPREDVGEIRNSTISNKELAKSYGVTLKRISQIKHGK